jgi:hypothetical protein
VRGLTGPSEVPFVTGIDISACDSYQGMASAMQRALRHGTRLQALRLPRKKSIRTRLPIR